VTIPERKKIAGYTYELAEVFANYGGRNGHRTALGYAKHLRERGYKARTEAHSGYTVVYSG